MAKFTSNVRVRTSSAQDIKDWVKLTHDAMIAVGCIQTSDTGQLDISSIAEPTAGTNYVLGYRVYEINDSLSSTYPIYIKIVFAPRRMSNSSGEQASPGGYIQVGFSTDGAGNIVGPILCDNYTFNSYTSASLTVAYFSNCLSAACKSNGYLFLAIGLGGTFLNNGSGSANSTSFFLYLKRTVDSNGAPDGNGCVVVYASGSPLYSSKTELKYQWGGRSTAYTGPEQYSPTVQPRMSSINGLIQANAADLSGWNYSFIDSDLVSLVLSGVTTGTNLKLSTDGITEKNYLVIPIFYSNSNDANNKGLHIEIDNRYKNLGALAVRFE
ncbi:MULTISPECIES: hypothetical protein [Acinetobacter]|uniref:Uncharacterized protein n=1 Tax=Acinetobacter higginsii TaxID=70347 RepID=N9RI26_9GAMM|nr:MULTISPECIES: hypothetical protein [Acinetobacter]ENX57653.1 hypothetical protein F902_02050 [Acinetobacter higginsii]